MRTIENEDLNLNALFGFQIETLDGSPEETRTGSGVGSQSKNNDPGVHAFVETNRNCGFEQSRK